jgi:nucleotide-binding universal stress UspA family protein
MFQKILVAIDGSECSRSIFDRALVLAKANRSELMLLHVLTLLDDFYPGEAYFAVTEAALNSYAEQLAQREQAQTQQLQLLKVEATAAGIPTEVIQKIGDPGKMICQTAKTWNANLIAIGRRGLSGLSELLMGSTSNYVLHHAPCNILIVREIDRTMPLRKLPTILACST